MKNKEIMRLDKEKCRNAVGNVPTRLLYPSHLSRHSREHESDLQREFAKGSRHGGGPATTGALYLPNRVISR